MICYSCNEAVLYDLATMGEDGNSYHNDCWAKGRVVHQSGENDNTKLKLYVDIDILYDGLAHGNWPGVVHK
jgi:hypothetical protein